MKRKTNRDSGFTLIELMVAIAIVGILAAVVLAQMRGYAQDARSAKALAQASSVIPSVVSCWGNGGEVQGPNFDGGNDICKIEGVEVDGYGKWSTVHSGDLAKYYYWGECPSGGPFCLEKSAWAFSVNSDAGDDSLRICCNGMMNGCKIQYYHNGGWGSELCKTDEPAN